MEKPKESADKPNVNKIRYFHLGDGLPTIPEMQEELDDMTDVLLGRTDPPITVGVLTLMEVASAYYARASELTAMIQKAEADGHVLRNSRGYKFRTGELRTFMEIAKSAIDLGSRRVTMARLEFEMDREAL